MGMSPLFNELAQERESQRFIIAHLKAQEIHGVNAILKRLGNQQDFTIKVILEALGRISVDITDRPRYTTTT